MMEIRILNDIPQRMIEQAGGNRYGIDVLVVKLYCKCGWEDKTFKDGMRSFALDHLQLHHGGTGKIVYENQWVQVKNNIIQLPKVDVYGAE